MKIFILTLSIHILCNTISFCQSLEIGQAAQRVKSLVEYFVSSNNRTDNFGNRSSSRLSYDVKYYDGVISDVILCHENEFMLDIRKTASYCTHYLMQNGILSRIISQYNNVSVEDIKAGYLKSRGNYKYGEMYYSNDFKYATMIYLGKNGLATTEVSKVNPNSLPQNVKEGIILKINKQKKIDADNNLKEKREEADESKREEAMEEEEENKLKKEAEAEAEKKRMANFLMEQKRDSINKSIQSKKYDLVAMLNIALVNYDEYVSNRIYADNLRLNPQDDSIIVFVKQLTKAIINEIKVNYKFPEKKEIRKKRIWENVQNLELNITQNQIGIKYFKNWDSIETIITKKYSDSAILDIDSLKIYNPHIVVKNETFDSFVPVVIEFKKNITIEITAGVANIYKDGTTATRIKGDLSPKMQKSILSSFMGNFYKDYSELDYATNVSKDVIYKIVKVLNSEYLISLEDAR